MRTMLHWRSVHCVAMVLAMLMFTAGISTSVHAGLIPTADSQVSAERSADMTTVRQALENKIVSQRLQELGYSSTEVEQRLAMLSDEELSKVASDIENLDTGGGAVGLIIGVLVITILVLVILELTGTTDNL